jgi:hypothetical protein
MSSVIQSARLTVQPLQFEDLTEIVINKMVFSKNLKNELFILVGDGTGDFQMEKIGIWNENTKKYDLCVKLQFYGNAKQSGYWIEDLFIDAIKTFIWTNITLLPTKLENYVKNINEDSRLEPIYTNYKCTEVFTKINENGEADKKVFLEIYDMILYKTINDILYVKTAKKQRVKIGFWAHNNFGGNDILFDEEEDEYERDNECDRYDRELGY